MLHSGELKENSTSIVMSTVSVALDFSTLITIVPNASALFSKKVEIYRCDSSSLIQNTLRQRHEG
jgi:hypothetical protein